MSTGQQPVLFLGPLYVVYKALTAIELAAQLETRLGVPVVPVFWIASDDHDWEEIGQATFLGKDDVASTIRFDAPAGAEGRAAGSTPLGEHIGASVSEASQLIPMSEFRDAYITLLETSYSAKHTVSEGFAATLEGVLKGCEYAWLDSADAAVKAAAVPLFARMFEDPASVLDSMARGEEPLTAAGFDPPIQRVQDGLPLFYDDGDRRQRVRMTTGGGFAAGREAPEATKDEWLGRLHGQPERFSANVASRPVLESWLMPVAATVLGPGEIAYWSQLGPVFGHFDVPFPAIQPRASMLAVEARVEKTLDRLGLEPDALADGGEAVAGRITAESRPQEVDAALAALRNTIGSKMAEVGVAVARELPGLKGAVGKTEKALHDTVSRLDRQVGAAVRETEEASLSRVRRAAAVLWPRRRPQERVLSPFHFLGRYGDVIVEAARERVSEFVSSSLATPTGDR